MSINAMSSMITIVVIAISVLSIAFFFFILYVKLLKPMQQSKQLLQSGFPGKAKILAINDTGVTVNQNPQVSLTLEVKPDDRLKSPYQAEVRMLISRLHIPQYQPGARLLVRYDPNNPAKLAVAGFDTMPL